MNPRGKRKTKTRTRHLVTMRVAYPAKIYGDARAAGAKLSGAMKVPPTANMRGVRVSDHDIKVKATLNRTEDLARTCSMLALGVYRMLNLSRKAMTHACERLTPVGCPDRRN